MSNWPAEHPLSTPAEKEERIRTAAYQTTAWPPWPPTVSESPGADFPAAEGPVRGALERVPAFSFC